MEPILIIPVNPEFDSHAQDLAKKLTSDLVRADIDDRDESMGRRVRESEKEWVPYTLVIGEKRLMMVILAYVTV